jgi:hypothetical protein
MSSWTCEDLEVVILDKENEKTLVSAVYFDAMLP